MQIPDEVEFSRASVRCLEVVRCEGPRWELSNRTRFGGNEQIRGSCAAFDSLRHKKSHLHKSYPIHTSQQRVLRSMITIHFRCAGQKGNASTDNTIMVFLSRPPKQKLPGIDCTHLPRFNLSQRTDQQRARPPAPRILLAGCKW